MLSLADAPALFASLKDNLTPNGLASLIKLHLSLAAGMARKYARRQEKQPDDYIAVAYLALVESVHNAFKYMQHNEITPYIVMYMKRALLRYYREDRVVAIPSRTQDHYFKLGHLLRVEVRPLEETDIGVMHSNDLLDALIEVIPDLVDRQVLSLRLQSHTDKEIAVLLNFDVKVIRDIRTKLKRILTEILEDDDE